MPCPYFLPGRRIAATARGANCRPPLGALHEGRCSVSGQAPPANLLEDGCNFGYAAGCAALPSDRAADAHRFVVAGPAAGAIQIRWAQERAHQPVAAGTATYDPARDTWLDPPPAELRAQLVAYLENYRAYAAQAESHKEHTID